MRSPIILLFSHNDNILAVGALPHDLRSISARRLNSTACAEVACEEDLERLHVLGAPFLNVFELQDSVLYADPVLLKLIVARARVNSASLEFTVTARMLPKLKSRSGGPLLRALGTKVDTMLGDHLFLCIYVVHVRLQSAVGTDWMRFERHIRVVFLTWVGGWIIAEGAGVSIFRAPPILGGAMQHVWSTIFEQWKLKISLCE
jgi:hypothetical protein